MTAQSKRLVGSLSSVMASVTAEENVPAQRVRGPEDEAVRQLVRAEAAEPVRQREPVHEPAGP